MTSSLEIQQKMLEAFLRDGRIELAEWIQRYPEWRAEIIDYRIRLELVAEDDGDDGDETWDDGDVLRDLIARHCQTLALGEAWAREEVSDVDATIESPQPPLSVLLKRLRSELQRKPTRKAYERVCVFTWCVGELKRCRGDASRLGVNKITYMLEKALDLNLFDHKQHPLGPYDRMIRYGAEPLAKQRQYIRVVNRGRYEAFEFGEKAAEALEYAPRYLRRVDLARLLVEHLVRTTRNDFELETWATVQWVAEEMISRGEKVTPDSVRNALQGNPKWAKKLTRSNFHPSVVARALSDLESAGLLYPR